MSRLFIDLHRYAGSIDGAVPGETLAGNFMGQLMRNHIIKAQLYPFEHRRPGMDTDWIIIIQRGVIGDANFYYRINIAAFFDFPIRIGDIAHEGSSTEFKIT